MRLTRIELTDFRNIKKAQLEFSSDRHFFLGANGQGKTNLLEAIALAANLKSFRTNDRQALIRTAEAQTLSKAAFPEPNTAAPNGSQTLSTRATGEHVEGRQAIVRTHWQHDLRGETVLGISFSKLRRSAILDNKRLKTLDEILGLFPVVALTLADRELVYGGGSARREEIDKILSQTDRGYHRNLQDYIKAVKARNQLLQNPEAKAAQFDSFETVMFECAKKIIQSREHAIKILEAKFKEAFKSFAPREESPALSYAPNSKVDDLPELWKSLRKTKDAILGVTTKGPHRDNFILLFNDKPAEEYASEGQKFSLVLALKLAGLKLLQEQLKIAPVIVADDLLLELDATRQDRFWNSIDNLQVFASGTVLPPQADKNWKIWNVKEGEFKNE